MNYSSKANSISNKTASIKIKNSEISFGITPETAASLPNPAELFLGSFCACVLKNVERFSQMINFTYTNAEIKVDATRLDKPPKMDEIHYVLSIYSNDDNLNIPLLKKNIEKFGTIDRSQITLPSGSSMQIEGITSLQNNQYYLTAEVNSSGTPSLYRMNMTDQSTANIKDIN